jgi:outer membrane immunogenic protein
MTTKLIRSGLAAAILLAAVPLAVHAADLRFQQPFKAPPYKAPPPPYVPPEPVYAAWSGFYVGVNGGYGFGKSSWSNPAVSPSPQGFVAGGTLGYNLQTGTWVWGLEGDIDYSGMKGSDDGCSAGSCETKATWVGTARLRVGYAGWNNFMPYITGGGALAGLKASSALGDASSTRFGWTAGAGLEYAFMSNWSAKVEYLYADLGSFDCNACSATGANTVDFSTNLVRAGINYRF